MYQLKTLVNRRNVRKHPEADVHSCEDFLLTVIESHILSAAMTIYGMESLDDHPDINMFPEHDLDL